jgi:hypothetical protein
MVKKSSAKKRATSPWIKHVKAVAKSKGIAYKDALKVAAKTYTKVTPKAKKAKKSKKSKKSKRR